MLTEGTLLARKYRLHRPAGFGGMAQLWVATNESTGVEVCIKVLVPGAGQDEAVKRFRREAHAAARLNHRAIVRVFDLLEFSENGDVVRDEAPVAFAIVMELLEGETLGDTLLKRGKLSLDETLDIAVPFLSALAMAHRAGIVHRDVKPDNVFLATDAEGQVSPKVLDFGVSKMPSAGSADESKPLTLDGAMIGTPSFMSPEQVKGKLNLDARSDVFSAGIVIVMMLSGKNPFDSNKIHSVVSAIMEQDPPRPPGVPDAIWAVLSRMLEKDPAKRYNDATEAGIALRRAAGRASITDSGTNPIPKAFLDVVTTVQPVVESASSAPPKPSTRTPKRRSPAATVALVLAAIAVALVLATILRSSDGPASNTAKPPEAPVPMPSATPHPDAARSAAPGPTTR